MVDLLDACLAYMQSQAWKQVVKKELQTILARHSCRSFTVRMEVDAQGSESLDFLRTWREATACNTWLKQHEGMRPTG